MWENPKVCANDFVMVLLMVTRDRILTLFDPEFQGNLDELFVFNKTLKV